MTASEKTSADLTSLAHPSADVDQAERVGDLRLLRITCFVAVLVYPAWGLFCNFIVPGSVNLVAQRVAISALWLAICGLSYKVRRVAGQLRLVQLLACCIVTAHYSFVVYANNFDPFYVIGIFVTLGAVDVLFGDVKSFVSYSVLASICSLVLFVYAPAGMTISPVIVAGVLIQQGLFLIGLRSRVALNERLREMNRVVQSQNEQLRALDRLKDDFVKSVSHELRSPLSVVQGYGELLREGGAGRLTSDQHQFVETILAATSQLEGLVGDLLDHARIDAGTFKLVRGKVDFNTLVDGVVVSLKPQADAKNITLSRSLPSEAVPMWVDGKRLTQVLTNLLSNAIKFTPGGGSIEVTERSTAGEVRVEVRDTGRGISATALEHVFDRFYQVPDTQADEQVGLGLGLAISKAIVEGHGGHIGVVSQKGVGSTFWITCPSLPPSTQLAN